MFEQEEQMNRTKFAVDRFKEGYKCSQAVLEAYAETYDIEPALARKIALPLAGGSAIGGECGAVSGAFMVLGLRYAPETWDDAEATHTVFDKIGAFARRFQNLHGSLNCRDLIGLDVFTEQGFKQFEENNIKMTRCVRFVEDAMSILEENV